MTNEAVLLDTNIIIDFILGLAWTIAIKKGLPKSAEIEKKILEKLTKILSSFRNSRFKILITEKAYTEFFKVMERYLRLSHKLFTERLLKSIKSLFESYSDVVIIINTRDKEGMVEKKLREYRIRFPREDLHIITCAVTLEPDYVCSDEDSVIKAIEELLRREGLRIPAFGGLEKFLDSLSGLGVISIGERILIGYFAYKLQRIPHVLSRVFHLQPSIGEGELKEWENYATRRFQRYIPPKLLMQYLTH